MSAESLSIRDVDYLLAIKRANGAARVSQISNMVHVAKSTASLMLKKLMSYGLVKHVGRGYMLTEKGEEVIKEISWRHAVVETALAELGIPLDEACRAARLIELYLPRETVLKLWIALGRPSRCPHGDQIGKVTCCRPLS